MTRGTLRKVLGWVKAIFHFAITVIAALAFLLIIASYESPKEKACRIAGGHYEAGLLDAPTCWAPDGRSRLFPEGW